jgi:glycosyltransferase involved in cell wall biosynthesis
MFEISIIIPVFNNQASIKPLGVKLEEIKKILEQDNKNLEIVFVEDGSSDHSLEELINFKKICNNVKIIKLLKNYGANNSIQVGFKNSSGKYISVLSADLQDDPDLILKMYDIIKNSNENLVVCERENRNDKFTTILFAKIFYKILKTYVIKNYPLNGFDIFMIKKELLKDLNLETLNPTISYAIMSMGFKHKKIFYSRKKRDYGKSQWTFKKKINLFWDIFIRYSNLPVKIISRFGLIFSLISILYGIYVLIIKLFFNIPVQGFATLAVLISFLCSIIIFMLGFIGEYLVRIYQIVDKTDKVIIEKYIE